MSYRILDAGDAALTIEFGSVIDPALLAAVNALDAAILRLQSAGDLPGVIETMPTFRSLTVFFDPLATDRDTVLGVLQPLFAAGVKDMTPIDVLVLHHVAHRGIEKRLADICFVLNVEDAHVGSYSLRKLAGLGLVHSAKRGKEAFFSVTDQGREICEAYRDVREACLMPGFTGSAEDNARIGELAQLLRTLSGRYDQAARAASTS